MKKILKISLVCCFALNMGGVADVWATNLSCQTVPGLMRAYLVNHVVKRELTKDLEKNTVDQYIKSLDPAKAILFKKDVEAMQKDLATLFAGMRTGDCGALKRTQDILLLRAQEVEKFVRDYLGPKYKFDDKVSFVLDPDKRSPPKDAAEREAFLKNYLHFQISNYLLTDIPLEEARSKLLHRYELVTKRVKERKDTELNVYFAKAFTLALDPHSEYYSNEDWEDFKIGMGLSLEGIGATLSSQDGFTTVEELVPGGAADRAKVLKPKDKITAVGQGETGQLVNVVDMELRDVVKLIRGKKGTKVKLSILRTEGKENKRYEYIIVRDKVDLKQQEAKYRLETRKVGDRTLKFAVIDLPSFYGDTERSSYKDMMVLVKKAQSENVDGMLLNLSRNGGGLLDDAVKISGLFIKEGGVVAKQDARKNLDILTDPDPGIYYSGPLVVLTSRLSASASEILAGAVKDYRRAVVVGGDHTFGKGTVQAVMPLPKGLGAMKVTTEMFFLPNGKSTQHQGVPGDVVLPSPFHTDEVGEKALDYSVEAQNIKAFLSDKANSTDSKQAWKPVSAATIKMLAKKSEARVKADKSFDEIRKDVEEVKKDNHVIKLSEVRAKAIKNKSKYDEDEKKTTAERSKEEEAPYINEGLNVLADLVLAPAS